MLALLATQSTAHAHRPLKTLQRVAVLQHRLKQLTRARLTPKPRAQPLQDLATPIRVQALQAKQVALQVVTHSPRLLNITTRVVVGPLLMAVCMTLQAGSNSIQAVSKLSSACAVRMVQAHSMDSTADKPAPLLNLQAFVLGVSLSSICLAYHAMLFFTRT